MKSLPCICGSGMNEEIEDIKSKFILALEARSWRDAELKRLGTRIKELEHILRRVREWGADARSADSYEIFRDVKAVLGVPELAPVVDCTCVPCACSPEPHEYHRYRDCMSCGARTCLAHELALKSSSRPSLGAKSRGDHE